MIDHGFYPLSAMVYKFLIYIYYYIESFRVFTGPCTFWRNMIILESFEVQNCTDASDF